jgi:DNA-binding Xre family transcriptional regulator
MIIEKSKLEILMAKNELKSSDLIKSAGISMDTLNRARKNQHLQPFTVGKIANALAVSIEDLVVEQDMKEV